MSPITNLRVLFNSIPQWLEIPEPGKPTIVDDTQKIDLENANLNGGFLVKTLVLGIDLYIKLQMRDPSIPSFNSAFKIGEPLFYYGVGVVLHSENPDVKAGDHIYGLTLLDTIKYRWLSDIKGVPWSVYVGITSIPGQTAYIGWKEYSPSKKGDVVFVSSGASTVGSVVIQLAKLDGCKVIASAGSEDKVKFMKSIGADVAFNYKSTNTAEVLSREGPIDTYWDNVGGEALDAALAHASMSTTFIECGMISEVYKQAPPMKNLFSIVTKEIHLHGFLVTNLIDKYAQEFYIEVLNMIADGKIKYQEERNNGLHTAGHAIRAVLKGENKAKSIVYVANDE